MGVDLPLTGIEAVQRDAGGYELSCVYKCAPRQVMTVRSVVKARSFTASFPTSAALSIGIPSMLDPSSQPECITSSPIAALVAAVADRSWCST